MKYCFQRLSVSAHADDTTIQTIDQETLAQEQKFKPMLSHTWGDNVLTTFNAENDIFSSAGLQHLKRFVEEQILLFVNSTRQGQNYSFDSSYTQSWLNVTRQFDFQERHNHDSGVDGLPISGAYYFRTNEEDGDLAIIPTDLHYKLFENYMIRPKIGKLVLFRSVVFHRVGVNLRNSDRISFSFNYLLKPNTAN